MMSKCAPKSWELAAGSWQLFWLDRRLETMPSSILEPCESWQWAIYTAIFRTSRPCDLLLVAGDICPDHFGPFFAREQPELQAQWCRGVIFPWLAEAPAARSILTWGNHDWCGMSAVEAQRLAADAPAGATVLVDALLSVSNGTSAVSVWASPWSNQFMNWAFMKTPGELAEVYAAIPPGTDIVVSHQPPHGFGDRFVDAITGRIEHLGSRELLATIERVRPKMVVCGHIHDGHGRYIHGGVPIYNVSIVNEQYRHVYQPTVIELS